MAWEDIKSGSRTSSKSVIRVDKKTGGFIFSSVFARQAEIEKKSFVRIYVDESSNQIAFEFSESEEDGSYKVSISKKYFSVRSKPCFNLEVVQQFSNAHTDVFHAQKLSKRWVIALNNEKVSNHSPERWKLVKSANRKKNGFVLTVNLGRLYFSKDFSKEAEIEKKKFVQLKIDNIERKLGFVFYPENKDDKFLTVNSSIDSGFYVQKKDVNDLEWVKTVDSTPYNDFKIVKEANIWVAQLCPAFEHSVLREDYLNIPSEAKGIYRYLHKGEVVYVGKGWIRNRFNAKPRKDWEFDEIQYSIIEDETNRSTWEEYWINFYEEMDGRLPKLNKIHGLRLNRKSEN
jgi:hypothetical protein